MAVPMWVSPGHRPPRQGGRCKQSHWEGIPGNTSKEVGKLDGLGEQLLGWLLSGKLPLKQLELNPAGDSGSQRGTRTSEHHQVRGGRGGGGAASLTLAAGHMHGQSGHQRPEMVPKMQVPAAGS